MIIDLDPSPPQRERIQCPRCTWVWRDDEPASAIKRCPLCGCEFDPDEGGEEPE